MFSNCFNKRQCNQWWPTPNDHEAEMTQYNNDYQTPVTSVSDNQVQLMTWLDNGQQRAHAAREWNS